MTAHNLKLLQDSLAVKRQKLGHPLGYLLDYISEDALLLATRDDIVAILRTGRPDPDLLALAIEHFATASPAAVRKLLGVKASGRPPKLLEIADARLAFDDARRSGQTEESALEAAYDAYYNKTGAFKADSATDHLRAGRDHVYKTVAADRMDSVIRPFLREFGHLKKRKPGRALAKKR